MAVGLGRDWVLLHLRPACAYPESLWATGPWAREEEVLGGRRGRGPGGEEEIP